MGVFSKIGCLFPLYPGLQESNKAILNYNSVFRFRDDPFESQTHGCMMPMSTRKEKSAKNEFLVQLRTIKCCDF